MKSNKDGCKAVLRDIAASAYAAVTTYSRLPLPCVDISGCRLSYVFCFFPVCGVFIGIIQYLWIRVCVLTGLSDRVIMPVIALCIPIFITGGIHMDGYMDTVDALSSYRDREQRLQIMKDPHVGAFGVLWTSVYMLIYCALMCDLVSRDVAPLVFHYALCRFMLSLMLTYSHFARPDGMLAMVVKDADKNAVRLLSILGIMTYVSYFIWRDNSAMGIWRAVIIPSITALTGVICCIRAHRALGGMTGDTCGYTIQLMEIAGLAAIALL